MIAFTEIQMPLVEDSSAPGSTMMAAHERPHCVYFLPVLHFCACLMLPLSYLVPRLQYPGAIVWEFVMMADLPVSLVAYFLAWKYGLFAMIWIFVVGTLWWYYLSVAFRKFRERRERNL